MTDISSTPLPSADSKTLGYVAGVLMILCAPAGLILSYIDRGNASPLLSSHYSYLIGTFWKGLLLFVVSFVLTFVVIGIFMSFAVSIWYLIRCIKSIAYLHRDQPIANPSTWAI
jgi:uncharacterized membrane protein